MFKTPFPKYVTVPWIFSLFLFGIWMIIFFALTPKEKRTKGRTKYYLYGLLGLSFVPVLLMFFPAAPDLQIGAKWFEENFRFLDDIF